VAAAERRRSRAGARGDAHAPDRRQRDGAQHHDVAAAGSAGADWKSFIESLCTVDRVFAGTPAFREDDFDTRDECRHAVEALARRGRISERSVAEAVVVLTRLPDGSPLKATRRTS
jgi:hypothetical protein